jgi:hypothetical protein
MSRRRSSRGIRAEPALALALMLAGAPARAAPAELLFLQGAWVLEGSRCDATFFRQGPSIHFTRRGATEREGVLIKGDRVEDSRMRCTIAKSKVEADRQDLLLHCFSGLLVSKFAFSLRRVDEDTVIRTITVFPEDQIRLRRCRL